jgi:SAM-dependent methyltransferase
MVNQGWYKDFFQGIVVDMWRSAVSPQQTRTEVDFLERALELHRGERVLDIPCGFGRHSVELAARGYQVTGVDISPEMIELARKHAISAGLKIEWRTSDMRDVSWESEFDAVFCFGNSFGYLDPEGTRDSIRAISRALKPGARFTFDYGMAAECILPRLREREWAPVDDLLFLEENQYDVSESCIQTTYSFIRHGKIEVRTGFQWVYTVREIRQMLQEQGLRTRSLHKNYDGVPFEVGSPILILLAEKSSTA